GRLGTARFRRGQIAEEANHRPRESALANDLRRSHAFRRPENSVAPGKQSERLELGVRLLERYQANLFRPAAAGRKIVMRLHKAKIHFDRPHIADIETTVERQIKRALFGSRKNIAIAVGSRGIANIARIVKQT